MSHRLPSGGRRIDRTRPLDFTFNRYRKRGFAGDTVASALLGTGQLLMGRSFKYHRPRSVVSTGAEEPNALFGIGERKTFEPNARATTTELFDGLVARTQNHWPSLDFDVGEINATLSRFLPAGFYYKTFLWPRSFWKHVYEPVIRASAGLGKPPMHRDADRYEYMHVSTDVLIIGGGIAGLASARAAASAGAQVLLIEQTPYWGGRDADAGEIDGMPAEDWVAKTVAELEAFPNVRMRTRMMGSGIYDHGYALAYERLTDHAPDHSRPRHRLWKVRARQIVTATGALERPISFAGNDLPGVMLASAVRDYVTDYAVAPGKRTVVVTTNDDAYRTAITLHDAGLSVPLILDAREAATGDLVDAAAERGIRIAFGKGIAKVTGRGLVEHVAVCDVGGDGTVLEEVEADCVAMSGGWSPVVHLWSHIGGKLTWDEDQALFRPDPERAPTGAEGTQIVRAAGAADGHLGTDAALTSGHEAGLAAATAIGCEETGLTVPGAETESRNPIRPVWMMPEAAPYALRSKAWLDYQNDVKVTDVELAAREGFESVEHAKRYTTLGMATDQGKLSNINGLAILSQERGEPIPAVGTTTFRPPYTPISMGAIAGEARGELFQPLRTTPIHGWHEANGADFEPVGQWRRPYAFPREGESVEDAVTREILNARENVGLLDASTLGKIVVKGPDAGRFLDMLYTNIMSTLPVGRCRYGLMCSENGFLMDDGVVARLDEDTWLCHTTTGGADRIHAHMEEWLQTEWWDWQVYVANVTEQYAQVAVVGPNARTVLEALGGMDVSKEALPFMQWAEGTLAGIPARVFRISFSGELSYEVAVPAGQGRAFWDACLAAGAAHGIMPYGTEALHVMRAEKGFIMIGDETDGTVIPQDLGLGWAISKKKDDYIGKRAQQRSHMQDPLRWRLVGLETVDGSVLPDGAYAIDTDVGQRDSRDHGETRVAVNDNGQTCVIGRVTSTYYSPTLGRGVAMGLVQGGPERMGDVVQFATLDGSVVPARIVDPVAYDPEGEKQNV